MQFEAIGTHWSIESVHPISEELQKGILQTAETFDQTYSRFRDDSLVMRMTRDKGIFEFPDNSKKLMEFYATLYGITDGAVTPLIGNQLEDAGYDKNYSFNTQTIRDVQPWDEVMEWNGATVTTTNPITLDVGAAGKGLLVDEIGELMESSDIDSYVIDASGDIRQRGTPSERVGLEDPYNTTRVLGVAELQNKSLCASASNRRSWGKGMHHIFDPRTKAPVQDVIATWVVADSTMFADGLATALFFVDGEALQDVAPFEYVRLKQNGEIEQSRGFVGELFI